MSSEYMRRRSRRRRASEPNEARTDEKGGRMRETTNLLLVSAEWVGVGSQRNYLPRRSIHSVHPSVCRCQRWLAQWSEISTPVSERSEASAYSGCGLPSSVASSDGRKWCFSRYLRVQGVKTKMMRLQFPLDTEFKSKSASFPGTNPRMEHLMITL